MSTPLQPYTERLHNRHGERDDYRSIYYYVNSIMYRVVYNNVSVYDIVIITRGVDLASAAIYLRFLSRHPRSCFSTGSQ
jgi:hypothetical protein